MSFILKHKRRMGHCPYSSWYAQWFEIDRGTRWSSWILCFRSVVRHWREQKWCRAGDPDTWLRSVMSSPESNPAGGMHGLLLRLHAALSEEDSRAAALTCHDIVGDLGHECMLVTTENELGKTLKVTSIKNTHVSLQGTALPPRAPFTNSNIYVNYAFATTPGDKCCISWMWTN